MNEPSCLLYDLKYYTTTMYCLRLLSYFMCIYWKKQLCRILERVYHFDDYTLRQCSKCKCCKIIHLSCIYGVKSYFPFYGTPLYSKLKFNFSIIALLLQYHCTRFFGNEGCVAFM